MGLTAIPMKADTGPIGGDLSHEFIILAETGESAVFCDSRFVGDTGAWVSISISTAILPENLKSATAYYAATEEMHDEAAFGEVPSRTSGFGARHRSGPYFLLWYEILRPDGSIRTNSGWRSGDHSWW